MEDKQKKPRGRPKKQAGPSHEIPGDREAYVGMLLAELKAATSDIARVSLLSKIGGCLGYDSPEIEAPKLRAGGRLPEEKTELLWLRSAILKQANGGRLGATMVESLRAIRSSLEELEKKVPPTPEQVEERLREDIQEWPAAHLLIVVEEAIRRGILQGE
jgi:hypothetical protein